MLQFNTLSVLKNGLRLQTQMSLQTQHTNVLNGVSNLATSMEGHAQTIERLKARIKRSAALWQTLQKDAH